MNIFKSIWDMIKLPNNRKSEGNVLIPIKDEVKAEVETHKEVTVKVTKPRKPRVKKEST